MTKNQALSTEVNDDTLAILKDAYPVELGANRISLPRLGMVSQDQVEGKGKTMKVVTEAGTFYIEKPTNEEDENGKKVWSHDELGNTIDVTILYKRKQLRLYDEATMQYTSSPIYDNDEEVLPLFCNKAEVSRGTPAELKAQYQYTDKNGKTKSRLEDNRILYVLYEGEPYQLNLRGTSMRAYNAYAKKVVVPSVITTLSSEARENGSNAWNQMTFSAKRKLSQEEAENVVARITEIKDAVQAERAQYQQPQNEIIKASAEAVRTF